MKMYKLPDFSFWQDDPTTPHGIDFTQTRKQTRGVILRCGQGVWEDNEYEISYKNARDAGLLTGNYFYYDNRYHPKRQAEKWASIVKVDELGCWLDLEQDLPGEYKSYKHWWDCVQYFLQLKPDAEVGIYTRASYFNDPAFNIPLNHALRHFPLWVAHYNEFVTHPDLPKGWTDWEFWQFSDHGDGYAHGVGSKEIDMNRFNGTEADFLARYGVGETPSTMLANFQGKIVEYRKVE